jgi:hypothetical protein
MGRCFCLPRWNPVQKFCTISVGLPLDHNVFSSVAVNLTVLRFRGLAVEYGQSAFIAYCAFSRRFAT